ncbi:poly(R)-hydroxyalkanoic acid synthase subunit PhaE [Ammoniphilus sp. 3BR4]|uniref:poly(R)-hydroxyalkanoic acid synthase subunit PhaE n=1 Tax=Ammoniphilus sp. 3BR4 TaxID=3158265 RepID=UPI003464ED31
MSQQMPFDPFALWKQFYDKAEEQWSQTMDEAMHKEEFSKLMGQSLNSYLQYQNVARQSAEKYLEQANMPSRQDVANVASLIVNVESKLDKLEEEVIDALNQSDLSKEVKTLKADMAKLSKRLDQLFDILEAKSEIAATKESKSPETAEPKSK